MLTIVLWAVTLLDPTAASIGAAAALTAIVLLGGVLSLRT